MGRPPKQKGVKEYLVNPRTRFLFSDAAEFREVFPKGEDHIYLTRAEGGKRLGKGTFRIIGHLPQKHNQNRDEYEQDKSGGGMSRFLSGGPLEASRMRYDAGSYPGFHLIVHNQNGKREEFYLTSESRYGKGSLVYATTTIPSKKNRQLVVCPVRVGHFGVSASKPGQYKLSLQKPKMMCGISFIKGGHVGEETGKKWDEKSQSVKAAESGDIYISEAESAYFYAAQGIDLLSVQDVEVSESENQVRAWSNPADAMTGNETLDGYETIDSVNVDLSSNQPIMNYGAEGKAGSPDYNPEDYSVVTDPNAHDPEAMPDQYCAEDIPVAEGTSLEGYEPVDSVLEEAPIGHGVTQNFGANDEPLLEESTTDITVEEGVSLKGYSGVDSVVVEPPLGHGVAQWYSEDGPEPPEPKGVTGQDGPSADPTNAHMVRAAESYARFEAELSMADRKKILKKYGRKSFVFPDRLAYPIFNKDYAERALAFAKWPSNKKNASKVRKAVHARYPSLAAESFEALGEPDAPYDQGYDDQEDESLGMRHSGVHEQSFTDRRDEAAGMERHGGRRKYSNVGTMDAQGYDDQEDESLGMRHRGSHKQSFKDRRDESKGMEKSMGRRPYSDVGTMDLSAENLSRGSKSSFWRGKGGHLYALDNRGRFITHNAEFFKGKGGRNYARHGKGSRRGGQIITHDAEAGYQGNMTLEGYQPMDSIEVDRSSYQPSQDYGAEAGYIGDMTLEGYQPIDSIEVDRSSYQPTQDYGADFKLEKPVTTGFMLSLGAFCFAGAAMLGTVLLGSLLFRDA